jgi:hypothetical protein
LRWDFPVSGKKLIPAQYLEIALHRDFLSANQSLPGILNHSAVEQNIFLIVSDFVHDFEITGNIS